MSGSPLHCRPARASDAVACAPLIFASGEREFRFFLGASDSRCIAFLHFAFVAKHGPFSWRRHYVACAPDGAVLSEMAAHPYRDARRDGLHMVWLVLRFFGPRQAPSILSRGATLGHELPAPRWGQTLLSQIATDERLRGTGVFTAMLTDALVSGWLPCTPDEQYVLDVRLGNTRARNLYERLGFVAQPRPHPPSARLPADLVSLRMAWSAQGIAALRARPPSTQDGDGAQSDEGSRTVRKTTARQPALS